MATMLSDVPSKNSGAAFVTCARDPIVTESLALWAWRKQPPATSLPSALHPT